MGHGLGTNLLSLHIETEFILRASRLASQRKSKMLKARVGPGHD